MNVRLLTILEGLGQIGSDWVVAMKNKQRDDYGITTP
jgi:hypothetical protein